MNPKLIEAGCALLIAAGLFLLGWHYGGKHVQAAWNVAKLEQAAANADANREYRVLESKRSTNVIEAQNAAQIRNQSLQVAVFAARAQSDSLRDDLAKLRRDMPGLAPGAIRQRADTLAAVLDQCQSDYRAMAANADAATSDVKLLQDAWPK